MLQAAKLLSLPVAMPLLAATRRTEELKAGKAMVSARRQDDLIQLLDLAKLNSVATEENLGLPQDVAI